MRPFVILVLAISLCTAAVSASNLVNWKSDDNALPEMLPKNMRGQNNEEIQKSVFDAYTTLLKIITEYNGQVYGYENPPFEYFKNEYMIPDSYTFQPETDFVFYNNVVRGLKDFSNNEIVIKWAPDQVETEVEWKNANIKGNYLYSNSTYFEQGKYHIQFENLKYFANTTLSENTVNYPFALPKSSVFYENVKASFSGIFPEMTDVNDSHNLKYFLEDIALQYIANGVAKSMHNNITVAIKQAIGPHIIFKNASDVTPGGFTTDLPSGERCKVDDVFVTGFNQTNFRVKNVFADVQENNRNVTAVIEFAVHKLSGDFTLQIDGGGTPYPGQSRFNVDRINAIATVNVLNGAECTANTTVHGVKVDVYTESSSTSAVNEFVAKIFANNIVNKYNKTICSALAGMLKSYAGNF